MGEKDKKFKELLNDKHIFLEFVKAFFPIEGLKEKDLVQEKTDFISKDYTEKRSDVLRICYTNSVESWVANFNLAKNEISPRWSK
jgi:hypothetical protein